MRRDGTKQTNALTNKKVEHDVGYDDVEGAEVDEGAGIVAAVSLPIAVLIRSAEWSLHLREKTRTH